MAKTWMPFPYEEPAYRFSASAVKKVWARLHAGDRESCPIDKKSLDAWIAYHAGDFQKSVEIGLESGTSGTHAANKAQCIYASYLERSARQKSTLFLEVAQRCEQQQIHSPDNVNAFYFHGYALWRYSQGISLLAALAQGLGTRIRASLEETVRLDAKHADGHLALGAYHAEVIDKMGAVIGGLTYGVRKDLALSHLEAALELNPDSALVRIEYANGLIRLEGKRRSRQAAKLYAEASECEALDATERLDVELARSELED